VGLSLETRDPDRPRRHRPPLPLPTWFSMTSTRHAPTAPASERSGTTPRSSA